MALISQAAQKFLHELDRRGRFCWDRVDAVRKLPAADEGVNRRQSEAIPRSAHLIAFAWSLTSEITAASLTGIVMLAV